MSFDDEIVRQNVDEKFFSKLKEEYKGFVQKITNKLAIKLVNNCQKKDESVVKEARKQREKREAKVFTKHKNIIYDQRMKILTANDQELMTILKNMITLTYYH